MVRMVSHVALVCAAVMSTPVMAQEQAPGAADADGDIIVTARKREERAVDVPIAVTAVSGAALEKRGAANLADFLQEAPGVGIYDGGSALGTKITIRGISTSLGANENGYYLDDLPFTGVTVPLSPDVRAWDLDRVEILRGPQGTLFGEGSMGGTVRILTRGADLDQWEAKGLGMVSDTRGGGTNGG
ncbi:TonB-dependent receptor plug domain-containing protein [Novosphingobium resinovorum]